MLQAAPTAQISAPTMRRGHAHKRSAAISGDFDLDFFQRGPSIGDTLARHSPKPSTSLPTESFMKKPPPTVLVTAPEDEYKRTARSIEPSSERSVSATTTPSPKKKHTRLNSWAHSLMKSKPKELAPTREYNSSSSTDTTPENVRTGSSQTNYSYSTKAKPQTYHIPEAIIDLDLASGVHYDPATSIVPTKTKNSFHRRTESAPELEDFFKYKAFSTSSNKNSRRNSAIYEEEEDDDAESAAALSTTSSSNQVLNKNPSINSLNSNSSHNRAQSPTPLQSHVSTPTSTKTRRGGASAARYQSYYNNNLLLANALKSSESLSQITGTSLHKPSYASFHSQKSSMVTPTSIQQSISSSSSASSVSSSLANSPSKFKFESREYDIIPGQHAGSFSPPYDPASSTPKAKPSTAAASPSPSKRSVTKKSHKKSNSLLNSLSLKIRGGSFSSQKSAKLESAQPVEQAVEDDYAEGDSTLTPFNFGEPGPALDLSTMKYYDDYDHRDVSLGSRESHTFSHSSTTTSSTAHTATAPAVVETPKKSRKNVFLGWMKK